MRILRMIVVICPLVALIGVPTATFAGGGGDGNGSTPPTGPARVDGDGYIDVTLNNGNGRGPAPAGPPAVRCQWVLAADDAASSDSPYDTKVVDGVTYRHYLRICANGVTGYWLADRSPRDVADSAASEVRKRLPKPTLGAAPPSTNGIVKFDMWLWTDASEFETVEVTASVPTVSGPLSATALARPLRLVFDPGEPGSERIVCAGPGQQWFPSDGDLADSDCMYAYQHSSSISPTGTFTATWSIVWAITWTSSTGAGGTLDDAYLTTSTVEMTVDEVQALITE